jgi:hypothetical protein
MRGKITIGVPASGKNIIVPKKYWRDKIHGHWSVVSIGHPKNI